MGRGQAQALARMAGSLVPSGIYAVEQGGYMELRNDPLAGDALEREVREWESRGFEVHANI